ncbi:outer membrane beta-barrel protein [Prevotella dentasini]
MKRLLLLSFIVLGALNARAQIVNERNKEKISQAVKDGYKEVMQTIKQDAHPTGVHTQWDLYVGARLGLNASNLPGLNGNMKTGITGGVFMEVFVFPNLAADIEVEYSHQGSGNVYHTVATDADAVFRSGPYDYNIKYINTNYLARWYPWADKPWSFYTGLHMARAISMHTHLKGGEKKDITDKIHRGDLAIPVGASFEWKQWQLDMRYNISFRRLADDSDAKRLLGAARNSMLQLTIGYKIQMW